MSQQYVPPTITTGVWVHWFPTGNPSEKPYGAMIRDYTTYGTVRLCVVPLSGQGFDKFSVLYIHSPEFLKLDEGIKRERGAWDFIPGLMPAQTPPTPKTVDTARVKNDGEADAVIVQMAMDNATPEGIAKALGGDWTGEKVSKRLKVLAKG